MQPNVYQAALLFPDQVVPGSRPQSEATKMMSSSTPAMPRTILKVRLIIVKYKRCTKD